MSLYSTIRDAIVARLQSAVPAAQVLVEGSLEDQGSVADHVVFDLWGPDIVWDPSDVLSEVMQHRRWEWHLAVLIPGAGTATDALAHTICESLATYLQGYAPATNAQKIELQQWVALGVGPIGTLYQLDFTHTVFAG